MQKLMGSLYGDAAKGGRPKHRFLESVGQLQLEVRAPLRPPAPILPPPPPPGYGASFDSPHLLRSARSGDHCAYTKRAGGASYGAALAKGVYT